MSTNSQSSSPKISVSPNPLTLSTPLSPSSPLARKRRRTDRTPPNQCKDCHSNCPSLSLPSTAINHQLQQQQQQLEPNQEIVIHHNNQHNTKDTKDNSTSIMASQDAQTIQRQQLRTALMQAKSSQEKEEIMQEFYAQQRQKVISSDTTCTSNIKHDQSISRFPGAGTKPGCEHYARKCWIKADCCQKYYPCRRCHDEEEDHEINRHDTKLIACVNCGDEDQPVSQHCRTCNIEFARYFCQVCKFYDDTPGKEAYHCEYCGICRVGKGLGIDNHHCHDCDSCIPIDSVAAHPCREASLDANCPICTYYLATSTEPVVFMRCGHAIHVECFNQHTARAYTCPICNKSLTDMKEWYRALDERIEQDIIPPEYQNRVSRILCHDCNQKSDVPFHFVYHRCAHCEGYNTRVIHQYDREPDTNQPTSATNPTTGIVRGREHTQIERATT